MTWQQFKAAAESAGIIIKHMDLLSGPIGQQLLTIDPTGDPLDDNDPNCCSECGSVQPCDCFDDEEEYDEPPDGSMAAPATSKEKDMNTVTVIVHVRGGVVQDIDAGDYADHVDTIILDWDDIDAEGSIDEDTRNCLADVAMTHLSARQVISDIPMQPRLI
jgi:hypothetical protein